MNTNTNKYYIAGRDQIFTTSVTTTTNSSSINSSSYYTYNIATYNPYYVVKSLGWGIKKEKIGFEYELY